jgi:membrane associated rhomboid family serine protease
MASCFVAGTSASMLQLGVRATFRRNIIMMDIPLVTYGIIAVTCIVSIVGFSNRPLFDACIFSIRGILQNKEVYRLITSQFFHVGWAHLLFNMFSFYSFSLVMERNFGQGPVAVIYFCSALAGDFVALAIKRKNVNYSAVGASGAVCGIIFSSIFLLPGGSIVILPFPVPLPSWVYAILFIAISLYGIGRGGTYISHEAHIGGALAGIACAVVYRPSVVYQEYILLFGLTVSAILLLIYFIRRTR